MAKKCILVTDGTRDPKVNEMREDVQPIYRVVEKYGYSFEIVADDGLFCEGTKGGQLKIETEGPNWVRHSAEFLDKIKDAEIIIISYSAAGKQFFEAAKELKFLGVMRGGTENVDFEAAKAHGVTVAHCPTRACEPTAEMTIAHILGLNRGITYVNNRWHNGVEFDFRVAMTWMPMLMRDAVVGLAGFGNVAKYVAQKISSLGCKLIAWDPYVSQEVADEYNVTMVSLENLMSQSDFVSIHVRYSPETHGIIDREHINLMKPTAFLINTARAGLIDEEALIEALENNKIRGAALDVFNEEPLPDDSILHKLENVVLTPHLAGGAGDGVRISGELMFAEVERWLKGEKLLAQKC